MFHFTALNTSGTVPTMRASSCSPTARFQPGIAAMFAGEAFQPGIAAM